jgi:hypothetical protein
MRRFPQPRPPWWLLSGEKRRKNKKFTNSNFGFHIGFIRTMDEQLLNTEYFGMPAE